uniref:glucuronosyltransferase n=1 Tax=Pristionchus pacificus TaxID=54126 RepID=A0A2A6CJC0_PRIPA|eukprot:PDM78111.1 Glycosyltransferase [Pristionchus pacificus]
MNTHFMVEGSDTDMFELDFDTSMEWLRYEFFLIESTLELVQNAYHNSVSFCIQCRKLLTTPGLVERLENDKFDVLITEAFENCGVGLSHLISPRAFIPVSSTLLFDPSPFGLYYSVFTEHLMVDGRFHSTLSSRLKSVYHKFLFQLFLNTQNEPLQRVFNELYPCTLFLSRYFDTTFIWKYENKSDDFAKFEASQVPNVILTEWMPQKDILGDPRLNLFISHAGMASCHEISHFGVPSLLIPIFGDQVHNAGSLSHIGIARVFNKFDMIHSDKIREAIGEMIGDEKYKRMSLRIRDQLSSRPSSPIERFVKNVEFAARFAQPGGRMREVNSTILPIRRPLRIGYVVEYSPFIIKKLISGSTSEFMTGILIDIWRDYTQLMGYNIDFIEFDSYGDELSEGEWTGILGEINEETIDGCIEKFKITSNRIRDFMYTAPIVYSSDSYVIRQRFFDKFTPSSYLVFNPLHILLFIDSSMAHRSLGVLSQEGSNLCMHLIFNETLKSLQEQCIEGKRKLLLEQDLYFNKEKESELFGRSLSLPSPFILIHEDIHDDTISLCESDQFVVKTDTFGARKMQLIVKEDRGEESLCTLTTVSPLSESDFPSQSILSSSIRNSNPYAFFFNRNSSLREIEKFNQVILKIYPFDMITGYYWRKYTSRDLFPLVEPQFAFTYEPIKYKDIEIIFITLIAGEKIGLFISICTAIVERLIVNERFLRLIRKR